MTRVRRWDMPEQPPPQRPYRDTFLLHLAFALIIVAVAWATGGSLPRAVAFAVAFFVLATAYSWWKWRQRFERDRRAAEAAAAADAAAAAAAASARGKRK
jgi:membrane protein implicated in regulation of membrane protease activity